MNKLEEAISSLRGGNKEFFEDTGGFQGLVGHSSTGKSYTVNLKIHQFLLDNSNTTFLVVNKSLRDLRLSFVGEYLNLLGKLQFTQFSTLGDLRVTEIKYNNGSRIILGQVGDKAKYLGMNFDGVLIYGLEHGLTEEEALSILVRSKSHTLPYSLGMIVGNTVDPLPNEDIHWLNKATWIKIFYSKLEDNPVMADGAGNLTDRGQRLVDDLEQLPDNLIGCEELTAYKQDDSEWFEIDTGRASSCVEGN